MYPPQVVQTTNFNFFTYCDREYVVAWVDGPYVQLRQKGPDDYSRKTITTK